MRFVRLALALVAWAVAACGLIINLEEDPPPADADADQDVDVDSDVDSDVDTDSDVDSDSDSDSDSDTHSDTDSDTGDCENANRPDPVCEEDGFVCTQPFCDGENECTELPSDRACDDGDPCTEDKCRVLLDPDVDGCVHPPIVCEPDDCSAEVFCDVDAGGCVYVAPADGVCGAGGAGGVCLPGTGCGVESIEIGACVDAACPEPIEPCRHNDCVYGDCVESGCHAGEACTPTGCVPWG